MGFILSTNKCVQDCDALNPWIALALVVSILGCVILFALFSMWFEG